MGKKPQKHGWPEAIRLCRLNRNDVEMAKKLGFRPDTLIRARPGANEKWKLPVNRWVRELYRARFGEVLADPGEVVGVDVLVMLVQPVFGCRIHRGPAAERASVPKVRLR